MQHTQAVGVAELGQVDPGEDLLEPLGLVAAEVELAEELRRTSTTATGDGTTDQALGGGVVAVEQREARHVQEAFDVDVAAAVDAPRHQPHVVVASPGADGLERVGQLAPQPAASEGGQLAQQHLGEQRVGERHRRPPARVADR